MTGAAESSGWSCSASCPGSLPWQPPNFADRKLMCRLNLPSQAKNTCALRNGGAHTLWDAPRSAGRGQRSRRRGGVVAAQCPRAPTEPINPVPRAARPPLGRRSAAARPPLLTAPLGRGDLRAASKCCSLAARWRQCKPERARPCVRCSERSYPGSHSISLPVKPGRSVSAPCGGMPRRDHACVGRSGPVASKAPGAGAEERTESARGERRRRNYAIGVRSSCGKYAPGSEHSRSTTRLPRLQPDRLFRRAERARRRRRGAALGREIHNHLSRSLLCWLPWSLARRQAGVSPVSGGCLNIRVHFAATHA